MQHQLTIDEEQRQLLLMALAHLAVERPGWSVALEEIALKIDNPNPGGGAEMFRRFKDLHQGRGR